MDFEKLYEPYKTDTAPSAAGQITWLQKEGFNPGVVDRAMMKVYGEMQLGKDFPSTKDQWTYLRDVAREIQSSEAALHLKHLEEFHSGLAEQMDVDWNKLSKWQKIKAVLTGRA